MEEVEFLFGPIPGEPQKPLRLIASSGELARVMLALKSALAKQDDTPLLIFDEIDANVGGEIARAVGMKMRELGREHQVISITHFPQVAALADHHYLISKGQNAEGRTVSRLEEVDESARIAELVRMLGASGPTAEAHARELLCVED
jgi:DNA repair protein RecN (Recombination protein N)